MEKHILIKAFLVFSLITLMSIAFPTTVTAVSNGKIAFVSQRDGNDEIYSMNADGSGPIRLTNNTAIDVSPIWSPDGTRIAFVSNRDGVNGDIYSMNSDGTGQKRLTNDAAFDVSPSWSPDGTRIAFASRRDYNYEIYVMNATDGTGQTRLTINTSNDIDPSWSPDGTRIAFVSNRDNGSNEIYTMNADGTGQTRLTNNYADDVNPSWSPDGTRIAFISNRDGNNEIYIMNPGGIGQTRLTNNIDIDISPTWSPDGTRIAFVSNRDGNDEIYIMNPDGTGPTRLTSNAILDWEPNWQPISVTPLPGISINDVTMTEGNSGTKNFVFTVTRSGDTSGTSSVGYATADGTATVANSDYVAKSGTVNFTDGQTSQTVPVVVNVDSLVEPDEIFFVNLSTCIGCIITDRQGTGTILHGKAVSNGKIAFVSNRDDNYEIYTMNADGTGQTRLTNNTASDVSPTWSPDGTKIAFVSNRDGVNGDIYSMNSDGTGQKRLTNNAAFDRSPSWSPDGTRIAFVSYRDGNDEIYVMNATDGTGQTRLTINTSSDIDPSWSPDGTRIAFASNRDNGNYEIYTMNANGTGLTRLTNNIANDVSPTWSHDGTRIAFASNRGGDDEIYIMNADSTGQTDMSQSQSGDWDPAFSPDGTRIAFVSNRGPNYEIYSMNPDGIGQTRLTSNAILDGEPSWQPISFAPGISINDVTMTEGNSGTKNFVFTVTRSDNTGAVSVQYRTTNNIATSPSDYIAIPLTSINFASGGSLTQTVTVVVNGDTAVESDETFFVNLSNCVGCSITDNQGVGTILNDDLPPPPPSIIVVSPNGGENWTRGTTQTIKWNSSGSPGAYVKIELLKPGVANKLIIASTPNDGVHSYLMPATQAPGNDYTIKITSTTNIVITDTSDNTFTIPIPNITVSIPNGTESWIRGTTQTIRWNSSGSPGAYVKIELLKGGVFNRTIIASTPNDGTHPWLILATQAPGTDYKVKITSTANASYNDTSDNSFTIPVPSIKVVTPDGLENWTRGTTQTIRWNSTENPKSYVKIELLKGGILNRTIIASTPNDGSHPWPILATQAPGTDYQVRITSTANISVKDTSENFTIPAPSITVKNPNDGESWIRGTTKIINWNSTENPKSYVKIELLKGGNFSRTIIASTLNDGSHPWPILATQAPGTDYQVRITSMANISVKDTSENFTIPVPSMTVKTPNGGENWSRGTTQTIKWNSTESPKSYVKIELLKAGVLNRVIIASTLNDGSQSWLIPTTQLIGSDYKIRINSTINPAITDSGDNNFNITV